MTASCKLASKCHRSATCCAGYSSSVRRIGLGACMIPGDHLDVGLRLPPSDNRYHLVSGQELDQTARRVGSGWMHTVRNTLAIGNDVVDSNAAPTIKFEI